MTSDLQSPLVPPEVDLRDFGFMPLDVVRLRDSGFAIKATGDEFRCAVLLWCASWHQTPAASLPDDDQELASLCGYGRALREWRKVRDGALRGFVLCSDGRLYHPVVAMKALKAWEAKLARRWRAEIARVKKHNQRHDLKGDAEITVPDFETWKGLGCPRTPTARVQEDDGDLSAGQRIDAPGGTSPKGDADDSGAIGDGCGA